MGKILPLLIHDKLLQIINEISLHAVNDLKEILLIRIRISGFLTLCLLRFPQILPDMVRIRECLYHSMIRNGNCRMSPLICTFNNVLRL